MAKESSKNHNNENPNPHLARRESASGGSAQQAQSLHLIIDAKETLSKNVRVMTIPFGDKTIDVMSPLLPAHKLSANDWSAWIVEAFPNFGKLESLADSPDVKNLSSDDREYLAEVMRDNAGYNLKRLVEGAVASYKKLSPKNTKLKPFEVVFSDLASQVLSLPIPVANITGTNQILVNTKDFELWCLQNPDEVRQFLSHTANPEVAQIISNANMMYLAGREEVNHIDYFSQHGYKELEGLDISTSTVAEYDARPWEFRALLDAWQYVKDHPKEFPNPEDGGPGTLAILTKRIMAARSILIEKGHLSTP